MSDVTVILNAIESGDANAAERLLPLVYVELRRLAAQRLAHESPGQTLQATALVHEAYVRLVDVEQPQEWNGRGHFFAAAAEAMRRILIENARHRERLKHGGGRERMPLVEVEITAPAAEGLPLDILALDEALERLGQIYPVKAELVKLRFFAGLNLEEAGKALGLSPATADRYWAFARAWLYSELAGR
jgi:RNA polymerase sigma factor (TIGR02999 family)